jgi:hypothetical protein
LGLREGEVTKKQGKLFAVYVKMRGKTRIWAKIIGVHLLDKMSKRTDYHIIKHFTLKLPDPVMESMMVSGCSLSIYHFAVGLPIFYDWG